MPFVCQQTHCRAFDTESAGSSYATGFVVDRKLGLILTNRHVVTPSPVVAEAVFQNREEIQLWPLYYDPVHDFGFFRFNPRDLRHMELHEIPLVPEAAHVGLDVKVVGNDSGEKISILSGTIARLDRDAPRYGRGTYNDFNTFYMQAASGTKGGSSGSPVIDIHGRAVGLNAGGKNRAASAYYLPLFRIVRALRTMQRLCAPAAIDGAWRSPTSAIVRGDLQTTFQFKGFDELKRLGLSTETEEAARRAQEKRILAGLPRNDGGNRASESDGEAIDAVGGGGSHAVVGNPSEAIEEMRRSGSCVAMDVSVSSRPRIEEPMNDASIESDNVAGAIAALEGRAVGMLVVDTVIPRGPGDGLLEPGDILVRVDGIFVLDFMTLESILDDAIEEEPSSGDGARFVKVEVERGGRRCVFEIRVQDLHAVTPKSFVEVGGGCVHALSYQQAYGYRSHVGQVYVSDAGYLFSKAGLVKHSIITGVGGLPTPDMDTFIACLLKLKHGQRVAIESYVFEDRFCRRNTLLYVDWCWYGLPKLWQRHNGAGIWSCTTLIPESMESVQDAPPSLPQIAIVKGAEAGGDGKEEAVVSEDVEASKSIDVSDKKLDVPGRTIGERTWREILEHRMRRALVHVDVEIPLIALADGVHSRSFGGCGIVVHCSDKVLEFICLCLFFSSFYPYFFLVPRVFSLSSLWQDVFTE